VDPRKIKVPEIRVTAQFDEELFAQFQESLREIGQVSPPIVYDVEDELVLCDGLHRIREAIDNNISSVDVAVLDGDMVDVMTKNIMVDHLRGKTPVSQMVKVIRVLYQEYNLDSDKIREKTGLTRDYVEKLIQISTASPVVQDALDQGIIGVGHAFELSRLPFAIQQEELIAKHQVYRLSAKELKGFIDQVIKEMDGQAAAPVDTAPGEPRPKPVYHCEGCKDEIDPRYLRPVMLCPNCFGDVWKLAKARETPEAEVVDNTGGG